MNGFSESLEPGAFLVDVIPSRESTLPPFSHRWGMLTIPAIPTRDFYPSIRTLRIPFPFCFVFFLLRTVQYVPDWFPGTGWKVKAKQYGKLLMDMATIPHQFVKEQMVSRLSCFEAMFSPLSFVRLAPLTLRGEARKDVIRRESLCSCRRDRWKCVFTSVCCRLLERPFRRTRPNCSTAVRSLQRSIITSNGRLLRYIQVAQTL